MRPADPNHPINLRIATYSENIPKYSDFLDRKRKELGPEGFRDWYKARLESDINKNRACAGWHGDD